MWMRVWLWSPVCSSYRDGCSHRVSHPAASRSRPPLLPVCVSLSQVPDMKRELDGLGTVRAAFLAKTPFTVPVVPATGLPELSRAEHSKRRHRRRQRTEASMHPVMLATLRELAAIEAGDTRPPPADTMRTTDTSASGFDGTRTVTTPSGRDMGRSAPFTPPTIGRASATPSALKTPSTLKRFFSTPTVTRESMMRQLANFEANIVSKLMAYESILKWVPLGCSAGGGCSLSRSGCPLSRSGCSL